MVTVAARFRAEEARSGWVALTCKHIVFTMHGNNGSADAGQNRNAMRRMIHALAAMGAALVFGCGGVKPDASEEQPEPVVSDESWDGLAGSDAFQSEAKDIGTGTDGGITEKSTKSVGLGWGLPSHLENQGRGIASYLNVTNIPDYATFHGQHPGRCGNWQGEKDALGNNAPQGCLMANPTNKTRSWKFDATSCTTLTSTAKTAMLNAARSAFQSLSTGFGWTFNETTGTPQLLLRCANSTEHFTLTGNSGAVARGPTGSFYPAGTLSLRDDNSLTNGLGTCLGTPTPTAFTTNTWYTYDNGVIFVDALNFGAWVTSFCMDPDGGTAYTKVAQLFWMHEIEHWLGFVHEFDALNDTSTERTIMAPGESCAAAAIVDASALIRPQEKFALNSEQFDNGADTNLQTNLACYQLDNAKIGDSGSFSEPNQPFARGWSASFTTNKIYGAQTGASHRACDFFSTGQICAVPSGHVIDWCFAPGISATFISDWRLLTGIGAFGAFNTIGPMLWVYHDSCNDPAVRVVIDINPCPGTNSSVIDGYVCTHSGNNPIAAMPAVDTNNRMGKVDAAGFGLPGTFYAWDLDDYITLSIDWNDLLDSNGGNASQAYKRVFEHAGRLGVLWLSGIGTRTDVTDRITSRAVLPLEKVPGFGLPIESRLTPGELCRLNSSTVINSGNYETSGIYCGDD